MQESFYVALFRLCTNENVQICAFFRETKLISKSYYRGHKNKVWRKYKAIFYTFTA